MKSKKKKTNSKIIGNIIPKNLNLSPIKVLSTTKKKVTNFYSEFKKFTLCVILIINPVKFIVRDTWTHNFSHSPSSILEVTEKGRKGF